MKQKGFTLVELLAVIIVFVTIGSLLVGILIGSLRGNNKTNTINTVRENGNYVITQIAKSIRNARDYSFPVACGTVANPQTASSFTVAIPDGGVITYACTATSITSASASMTYDLIDTNAISVVSCQFSCGQDSLSDYPIIGIDFSLLQKNTSTSFVDLSASASAIPFQTAIVLRNLNR